MSDFLIQVGSTFVAAPFRLLGVSFTPRARAARRRRGAAGYQRRQMLAQARAVEAERQARYAAFLRQQAVVDAAREAHARSESASAVAAALAVVAREEADLASIEARAHLVSEVAVKCAITAVRNRTHYARLEAERLVRIEATRRAGGQG